MNHEDFRALAALFEQRFTQTELRRWLAAVPEGQEIVNGLPEVAPIASFAHDAADIIKRRGTYKTAKFWDVFEQAAGTNEAQKFRDLRTRVGAPPGAPLAPQTPASQTTNAAQQAAPTQLTVLLVSASPDGPVRIRVDKEFRKIIEKVRGSKYRDRFRFVQLQAARFEDLQTALHEHNPQVLHISSHGHDDGSLQFEAGDENSGRVSKKRMLRLLKALRDNLRIVIVNACHSRVLASEIPQHVDLAIGMNNEVPDSAAIAFSSSFYESLSFGRTVETAYEAALSNVEDDEGDDEVPELFPLTDNDPESKRKLILVKPSSAS